MHPLQNKHVDNLTDFESDPFKGMYVEQVIRGRDSVFDEMCQDLDINDYRDIRAANMGRRTITKDKLAGWLETVCCILDSYAVPLLEKGEPLLERIEQLQEEKIKDQETIINLQGKLIEKREDEISAMKATVESEMKTYSSAVTKTCSVALAPSKIQAAVKKVTEKHDRDKNIVIYGVEEKPSESLETVVEDILAQIDEKPLVKDVCRIGLVSKEKCRPIMLTLTSSDHVSEILRKTKRLRTKEGYKTVYICPDRSVEERKALKKLLEELKSKRKSDSDGDYRIRNNKVVRIQKSAAENVM